MNCRGAPYSSGKIISALHIAMLLVAMPFGSLKAQTPASFTWLKAVNSSSSSGMESRDIDGSTAELLFPLVASEPPLHIEANFERQFKLLSTLPDACSGKKIYTPQRAEQMIYSELPQLFSVGLRLYVRQDNVMLKDIVALSHQGTISLSGLAQAQPKLMLGAVAGRSYTTELDNAVQQFSQQNRLWLRHAEDMAAGMTLMLASNRVDAVIEYPTIMADLMASKPIQVESFAIDETPAFINGYIVCSASEQGRALIARFNQAIATASKDRRYLDAHLKWFKPELHPELIRYYNSLYGTDFKLSMR